MSPIAVSKQARSGPNGDNADARRSSSSLLGVTKERAAGLKKWKSLTRVFEARNLKKESSPALRQTSLAINVSLILPVPALCVALLIPYHSRVSHPADLGGCGKQRTV